MDTSAASEVGVKIRVHRSLCNAWGACARFAPEVYFLDDDGFIGFERLEVPSEFALQAWVGATACPEQAITVIGLPESYWRTRMAEANEAGSTDRTKPQQPDAEAPGCCCEPEGSSDQ